MPSNIARFRRWCLLGLLTGPAPLWAATAPTLGLPLRLPGGPWPTTPFPAQVLPALLPRTAAPAVALPVASVAVVAQVAFPKTPQELAQARRPEAVVESLRESLGMTKEAARPEPLRLSGAFDGSEVPAPKAPAVDARPQPRGSQPKPARSDGAKPKQPTQPSRPYTLPEDDLMRELGLGEDWR